MGIEWGGEEVVAESRSRFGRFSLVFYGQPAQLNKRHARCFVWPARSVLHDMYEASCRVELTTVTYICTHSTLLYAGSKTWPRARSLISSLQVAQCAWQTCVRVARTDVSLRRRRFQLLSFGDYLDAFRARPHHFPSRVNSRHTRGVPTR